MTTINKSLPNDLDSENTAIAEALINGGLSGALIELVPTDFYAVHNQILWGAITDIHEASETLDTMSVWHKVKENEKFTLKIADLNKYIVGIPHRFTSKAVVRQLQTLTLMRQTLKRLDQIQSQVWEGITVTKLAAELDGLQQQISNAKSETNNFQSMADVMRMDVYPRLEQYVAGISNRTPTGFDAIDRATLDGIGSSELWIIAALTSEGKSAFALQTARQIAERGVPVACISREMLNYENGMRALSQLGQFNNGVFRAGMFHETRDEIVKLGEQLEPLPLYFDDKTNNVKQLKKNVSTLIADKGIKVLFIDYLQLLQSASRENRQAKLEEIVNDLKDFAMQQEIGIVLLSQFNREASKIDALPKISDLDGASAIEKAGNVIILWKLEEMDSTDNYTDPPKQYRPGRMKIAKGRHTAKSEFDLKFYGSETRFEVY